MILYSEHKNLATIATDLLFPAKAKVAGKKLVN
jgi:hypothetical protein